MEEPKRNEDPDAPTTPSSARGWTPEKLAKHKEWFLRAANEGISRAAAERKEWERRMQPEWERRRRERAQAEREREDQNRS